jgi:HAD superfamily hydrolase (TIGR01490 family)
MKIAFFDFDGTITTKDTMFELIRHQKGAGSFYVGFLLNIPVFAALKLKLITNQAAKERLLTHFFKGMPAVLFQTKCDAFADDKLPSLIRPAAITEMEKLKAAGFQIVIVSASAQNWIRKWADKIGVKLIATELEVNGNLLTGKVKGQNCNGEEKEVRIKSQYDLSKYDEIYCYGDSGGDKQMLAMGTKSFYKPFRQ